MPKWKGLNNEKYGQQTNNRHHREKDTDCYCIFPACAHITNYLSPDCKLEWMTTDKNLVVFTSMINPFILWRIA